ncbi:uncharacterized protein [Temnothorax nylanderi]|uniref:uncharacterized protein isoform X2 n=1 Tax=Temnothorax nylanderi TaxID=102681 RepID=UPI003A8751A8
MSNATNLTFTCVNDLLQKGKINFAGKKPRNVYQRLPVMRKMSDLAKKQGDDEAAYIMLKRWLDSVEWLKDGKSVFSYATNMTVDQINEVKNVLADMKQKLEVRYELNSKKQNNTAETTIRKSWCVGTCIRVRSFGNVERITPSVTGPLAEKARGFVVRRDLFQREDKEIIK